MPFPPNISTKSARIFACLSHRYFCLDWRESLATQSLKMSCLCFLPAVSHKIDGKFDSFSLTPTRSACNLGIIIDAWFLFLNKLLASSHFVNTNCSLQYREDHNTTFYRLLLKLNDCLDSLHVLGNSTLPLTSTLHSPLSLSLFILFHVFLPKVELVLECKSFHYWLMLIYEYVTINMKLSQPELISNLPLAFRTPFGPSMIWSSLVLLHQWMLFILWSIHLSQHHIVQLHKWCHSRKLVNKEVIQKS